MLNIKSTIPFIALMVIIVSASNYLVQIPVDIQLGTINLAQLFTWGAFIYPIAFLVTDMTNRKFGPQNARFVVIIGFILAVIFSIYLATPRIAIASGSAFFVAQMLDIGIFNKLRNSQWWLPPLISSIVGSTIDTAMFFSIAFSSQFDALGYANEFAVTMGPLLGSSAVSAPHWVSWALTDFFIKIGIGLIMLVPYGAALPLLTRGKSAAA